MERGAESLHATKMEDTRWHELNMQIINCTKCPRLVEWRLKAALNPPRRHKGEKYWAKPLPGFGDKKAKLIIVGLAPAVHGGNRTGRMFTGDSSGNTLMRALYELGIASKPTSTSRDDGLEIGGAYITAVVRCAPPQNRPTAEERRNCLPYLMAELSLLKELRAAVALGKIAYDGLYAALRLLGYSVPKPKPKFRHGQTYTAAKQDRNLLVAASYHPSRQNTQTGRLTHEMLVDVLRGACLYAGLCT